MLQEIVAAVYFFTLQVYDVILKCTFKRKVFCVQNMKNLLLIHLR